jgi:hypothetical protein
MVFHRSGAKVRAFGHLPKNGLPSGTAARQIVAFGVLFESKFALCSEEAQK